MVNLTFGEQVKIILSRKGMTIKELAEKIQERTGKNMSRQNMTQRLGRDNFQEQDMRLIAEILGCSFQLSIMEQDNETEVNEATLPKKAVQRQETKKQEEKKQEEKKQEETAAGEQVTERDITVGELVQMNKEILKEESAQKEKAAGKVRDEVRRADNRRMIGGGHVFAREKNRNQEEEKLLGERNPYTGKEYQTNSVRMHPKRIGYVQVYDQEQHAWTDMTEWAFLGYQERKKRLLGKDYVPPIYLD